MTWRRFHLILCILMAVVFVLRLVSGNIIGAIVPLILAGLFASVAFDFSLWGRLKRVIRLVRRVLFGSD